MFARARENARRSSCQSNLKQIGVGLLQYIQDYDERTPFQAQGGANTAPRCFVPEGYAACNAASNNTAGGWRPTWIWEVQPYIKSWQVFACPSAVDYRGNFNREAFENSDNSYTVNGVAMNRSIAAIPATAELIWAQEFAQRTNTAWVRPYVDPGSGQVAEWLSPAYSTRHFDDGGNLLFVDGHVKFRKQNSIAAREYGIDSPVVGFQDPITNKSPNNGGGAPPQAWVSGG